MAIYSKFIEYFTSREQYSLDKNNFLQENWKILLASLVTFIGVVLWRSWPNYAAPNLFVEDTTHYFNYFYGNTRDFSSLFHNTNGYINILNNLLGMYVAKFDVRLQPYMYAWIGTFFCTLVAMSLSFSGIFKNKYIIFIAPFFLGLTGLNHVFYYVTLTYQIYILVILMLTLLFWEPVKNKFLNLLFFLLLSLLIWSGPFSVLAVPFAFCFILLFKGKTKLMLSLVVVTFLYLSTVNESTIWLHNILDPNIRALWISLLVEKIFFLGLAGPSGNTKLLFAVCATLSIVAFFRKDFFYLKIALMIFMLINGALGALLLSKKIVLYQRVLPCYLVIAQFLWVFFILFTVDRVLAKSKRLYHGGAIACLVFITVIMYDNYHNPSKWTSPEMASLPIFLDTVYKAEQLPLAEEGKVQVIYYGNHPHFKPSVKVGSQEKGAERELIHIQDKK